jgi:hypothetical protein
MTNKASVAGSRMAGLVLANDKKGTKKEQKKLLRQRLEISATIANENASCFTS